MPVTSPLRRDGPGPVEAVLLSAGRGRRLRPLTDVRPKPCLPLLDVPLGAWGLSALLEVAASVVVNVSHLPDKIAACLGLSDRPMVEVLEEIPVPWGTGGTMYALRHRVKDRVITWNADTVTDLDARALLAAHRASAAPATVAVVPVPDAPDFGVEADRVIRLVDRRTGTRGAGTRFIGCAVFESGVLERLPDTTPIGLTEGLLRSLIEDRELAAYVHDGYALDAGTPERYLRASQDLLSGAAPRPPIDSPGEVIDVEGGRAYRGPGVHAASESLGVGAVVLAGARIDAGARVERSVVLPEEVVPEGTLVDGAVWFGGRALDATS